MIQIYKFEYKREQSFIRLNKEINKYKNLNNY